LNLQETIYPVSGGGQWAEFVFSSPTGGPLSTDFGSEWRCDLRNIPMSQPVHWDNFFLY
jgi:hypothetical protein